LTVRHAWRSVTIRRSKAVYTEFDYADGRGLLMLEIRRGEIMKRVEVPLSKLTLAQKLDLMKAIWDDLTRQDKVLESPLA